VAIEQNHWPREWTYMIRIEEIGKSPELLMAILDRGSLNSQDISTRICPKAVLLADREVAFFFNEFERLTQVTIIQQGSPCFYETVRMVQPLRADLPPRMKLQDIESHRLFTMDMSPSYTTNLKVEAQLGLTPKSMIKWGPKIAKNSTPDTREDTAIDLAPFPAWLIATESNPYLGMPHLEATGGANGRDTTIGAEGKRKLMPKEGCTVVISKKRRFRGTPSQKILIIWRNVTIPCTFSDQLTPATLITDIGNSALASLQDLAKATLTPPNNPLSTLQLETPL